MHRIDNATAANSLPTPAAAGTAGYFKQRSATARGTVVSADWLNAVQEEICGVIEAAGISLDKTDNTQLLDAINALIADYLITTLTGNLDVLNYKIVSSTGDITFQPTSGNVTLDATNIYVGDNLYARGLTTTGVSFAAGTQTLTIGASNVLDLSASGLRLGAANARVTTILDEDDMVSDSATALITQQSAKAYVDALASSHIRFNAYTDSPVAAGETYYFIQGIGSSSTPGTGEGYKANAFRVPFNGTLSDLTVFTDTAPGVGETYTITLMNAGSDTTSTCTISGTNQTASDNVNTPSVTAGDFISIKIVASASAATVNKITASFKVNKS